MRTPNWLIIPLAVAAIAVCLPADSRGQAASLAPAATPKPGAGRPFVHPGINQRREDLDLLRKKVLAGEQPYAAAFTRLKAACDTSFTVIAHTHVLRGPYGKPNIGGEDLSKGANMAYNYALAWYITRDKTYADRAIDILNAWSATLWDLDYNDAKLLAAWTGHLLCNAAEILRYSGAGWSQKDIASFSHMLMTVYYPLMRPYYPQANGNWDGAITHSLIAIAIFTDNRALYDNAVDHFKHAPVNGSIFKYIYSNGECQESPRDQGHVQLGLGEFAGAAQVAYTQGTDLFAMAGNRIALGYEYTARFLLGETPYCYCTISERSKVLRDDYEYVYRHYTAKGVDIPYTKRAADSIRPKASRSVLTAVRASFLAAGAGKAARVSVSTIGHNPHFAIATPPADAIVVVPGASIQQALDAAAGSHRWVLAKAGIHTLPATLRIPSGITLAGEGASTILFLDPASGMRETMTGADSNLHDVTIRDLVIEGSNKTDPGTDPNSNRSFRGSYNRGGILFRAEHAGGIQHLDLINLTIRNSTYSGISIAGGSNVHISNCDISENGANPPPGPKLNHNLLLTHCTAVNIQDCRLVTSPFGCGVALDQCSNTMITHCEIARNGYYGVLISESKNILVRDNLIEANDNSGVMEEFLSEGNEQIAVLANKIQYNNGYGLESHASRNSTANGNINEGNKR